MSDIPMSIFLLVIVLLALVCRVEPNCDSSRPIIDQEGYMGRSQIFPWLGVLRVHLREPDKVQIALSGVVLIHKEFALVNADDIARIPMFVFDSDTSVMFLASFETPWFCVPTKFHIHPEYEKRTFNTIALLELDMSDLGDYPLVPICWSRKMYSSNTSLYVTGYNDDSRLLEKVIYKMHIKEKNICEATYEKAGLNSQRREPTHYRCYYTKFFRNPCIWENGMILMSNSTNYFYLAGFGIRGPGCATPSRFIDLEPYTDWIGKIIYQTLQQNITRHHGDDVPLHALFHMKHPASQDLRRHQYPGTITTRIPRKYTTPAPELISYAPLYHENIYLNKTRLKVYTYENNTMFLYVFNDTFERYNASCKGTIVPFYTDWFVLDSYMRSGHVFYKVSVFDLELEPCVCVKVNYEGNVTIVMKSIFETAHEEGSMEETPDEFLKYYQIRELYETASSKTPEKKPSIIEDDFHRRKVPSYDIYFDFRFDDYVRLSIEMSSAKQDFRRHNTIDKKPRKSFPLTSEEEREAYLKKKRQKPIKPPTRSMWYDETYNTKLRSGFVKDVPETVLKTFGLNASENTVKPKIYRGKKLYERKSSVQHAKNSVQHAKKADQSRSKSKSETGLIKQLPMKDIFSYIRESAVPREVQHYTTNVAATYRGAAISLAIITAFLSIYSYVIF